MSMMKWDPFKDLIYMHENINKIFNDSSKESTFDWTPKVNIVENNDFITIIIELPGVHEEDMEIQLSEGVLSITGYRKNIEEIYGDECCYKIEGNYGKFLRSFAIPNTIDSSKTKASLKDGVLTITLFKSSNANIKTIRIERD